MTIVEQFGIKISSFTPSSEVLGHLMKMKKKKKNNNDDENSKIAYERNFLCEETKIRMARERSVSEICEVLRLC